MNYKGYPQASSDLGRSRVFDEAGSHGTISRQFADLYIFCPELKNYEMTQINF
jgi:hypothetical protein